MKNALIIFAKNLQSGKVKTRLAAKLGIDEAFSIYKILLQHTYNIASNVDADKYIFYSDFEEEENTDVFEVFHKEIQQGNNLGERMENAFQRIFFNGYDKIVIIGSDCMELTAKIIDSAFDSLTHTDIVIGPAADGGYYLLAMQKMHKKIFHKINWSTDKVLQQTLDICREQNLSYKLLEILHDVDVAEDWERTKIFMPKQT